MTSINKAPSMLEVAEGNELEALLRDAVRWRYFGSRVAAMLGITLDEMSKEIDEAVESERTNGSTGLSPKI